MSADSLKAWFEKSDFDSKHNVEGKKVTTLCVGGAIQNLLEPHTIEELVGTVLFLREQDISFQVLGGGSNLLIPDSGVECAIRLGKGFRFCEALGASRFKVGGAMPLMRLSQDLSKAGYAGLEFAGGIPAVIGGATRMNAGAHGGQMSDVLRAVSYVTPLGELVECSASELSFSYRSSSVPKGSVIAQVVIELQESDSESVLLKRAEFLAHRKKYQPLSLPSAGSIFKNPSVDLTAGRLIESLGLKGHTIGDVSVSKLHANWIVNPGKCGKASDVISLIELIQARAKQSNGVELETELVQW